MLNFGEVKKVNLRDIWKHEANDFTPWLENNINTLGNSLGLDLEVLEREANHGDFSVDLVAKDLGSGDIVIIENQLTLTDHDHLGKLITYASGFNASKIIWISEFFRDEHRQAMEWLNQRTDTETQFFGVIISVMQIDDSKPAFNFNPIVFPNEWQKQKKKNTKSNVSVKGEAYRVFYQGLIDDLRENYKFTGARVGQPQNWYAFSSGFTGIPYSGCFSQGKRVRVELYIDQGDVDKNKQIFDSLYDKRNKIESNFDGTIEWERLDDKRASRIAIYRDGTIDDPESELSEIHSWMVENLIKFKKIFGPYLKKILK